MKSISKYGKMAAVAAVMVAGLSACNNDDDNTSSEAAKGTDAAVEAACESWKSARQDWEWSEAFLFGPAGDFGIDPHIDTWPFNVTSFSNYMKKYHPATNSSDAELIDEAIATGQNLTGFHAVEYLIFRNGAPRKVADISTDEAYFCSSAAADLYLNSLKLVSAWGGDLSAAEQELLDEAEFESKDYAEEFVSAGQAGSSYPTVTAATLQIIAGCNDIIGEVRDSKIGAPASGDDVNYIESPHAYNSVQDFYDNIMSCKHALYGGWTVTGEPVNGSLLYFAMHTTNDELTNAAKDAQLKMEAALVAVNNMKKPFVLYYSDQSAKAAMAALDDLESSLDVLSDILATYSGNATAEAQLQKVNEQYVNQVVKPTYRALADNNAKLVNNLKKIEY